MTPSLIRLPIVRNTAYKLNGQKSYVYALNKYNIVPTQPSLFTRKDAQSKLTKQQADGTKGVINADDQMNDSFWTCPIQIGTPPQIVDLDLDSGSADLWVWSNKLAEHVREAGKENNIKIFDSTKSSTFKTVPDATWLITYGDGSGASGVVGTDNVTIGSITIKDQGVELAKHISSQFQNTTSSGLLGLAFGNINTVQPNRVKTPVENMILQNDIPASSRLWSVYLGSVKDINDPDHGKSFYTFGSYDQSIVNASKQEISWTPVDNSQGFWMFGSETATVNGKTIKLAGNQAIADTGTTLMIMSDEFCQAVYSSIEGARYDQTQGGWLVPSGNVNQRPEVTVACGDKLITIEKEQLSWADLDDGSGMAFGAVQSRGNNTFDILGATFLMCCYAIFDVGNTRFGVVQRAEPTPAGH